MADEKAPVLTIDQAKAALNKIDPDAAKTFEGLLLDESQSLAPVKGPEARDYSADKNNKLKRIEDDKFYVGYQVNDAMVHHAADPKVKEGLTALLGEKGYNEALAAADAYINAIPQTELNV